MSKSNDFKWVCPNAGKGCESIYVSPIRLSTAPSHMCSYMGGTTKEVSYVIAEESQKQLAIRTPQGYGHTHTSEKTSGQPDKEQNMATRPTPAPDTTEAPTEPAKATKPAAKTTAKAAKAPAAPKEPKAPKAPKPAAAPAAEGSEAEVKTRRRLGEKGHLADSVEDIFRKHEAGKLRVDGKVSNDPLTVHTVRGLILNSAGEPPSTGAVSAVFARWAEAGYIKISGKPVAFTGFATKWSAEKMGSLAKFLDAQKDAKAKARAAAKPAPAEKPAKPKAAAKKAAAAA